MGALAEKYAVLKSRLAEVMDLRHAAAVLYWDQQVCMPKGGARARGDQLATLSSLTHGRFTSPEVGELLTDLAAYERQFPYDSEEASMIRVSRRQYEQRIRVPTRLVAELTRAGTEGYAAWLAAREADDFRVFCPALERLLGLLREKADALGFAHAPLQAFLNDIEPGMALADVEALFAEVRSVLVPLVRAIASSGRTVDDAVLYQPYAARAQWEVGLDAAKLVGFDLDTRGRQDRSVHPFTIAFSADDVRITTRLAPDDVRQGLFASLHEAGHGAYCQGIPASYDRTPLGQGASGGVHESQSRLWENIVGRSLEFWQSFYPRFRRCFPGQTDGVPLERFHAAVNRVQPSPIRVEADEVTYNLHIMVRHELERAVYRGDLAVADLADAWDAKYEEYLGIRPPNHVQGILQDIHWSGHFGASFVGYTLGNIMSAQLFEAALRDVPDLRERIALGDLHPLRCWMNEHVHALGAKLTPAELIERATGARLSAAAYRTYVTGKFTDLYGL
ncbi:MAG: carboxypeptidase M32 [Bacillota bacterium]